MRELLYLSKRKLDSFHIRELPAGINTAEIEVQLPPVTARLGAGPRNARQQADFSRLEKVTRRLDRQAIEWYPYGNVSPGNWVRFDLPMGFSVFGEYTGKHPVALFAGTQKESVYPKARLLLCGSPVHIVGGGFQKDNYWASQGRYLDRIARLIDHHDAQPEEDTDADNPPQHLPHVDAVIERELLDAYRAAARRSPQRTRARLSGHARVLFRADEQQLLVATPLYVQYGEPTPPRRLWRRKRV